MLSSYLSGITVGQRWLVNDNDNGDDSGQALLLMVVVPFDFDRGGNWEG